MRNIDLCCAGIAEQANRLFNAKYHERWPARIARMAEQNRKTPLRKRKDSAMTQTASSYTELITTSPFDLTLLTSIFHGGPSSPVTSAELTSWC